jgi:hypothetical protein
LDWDKDGDVREAARGLVFGTAPGDLAVSIPALGEVLATGTRDFPEESEQVEDPLRRLRELESIGRLSVCGPGHHTPDTGYLACVRELHELDDRLDPTDVLILAAALCCQGSVLFYTNDVPILNSTVVRRAAESRGVKIVNPM